ncbi:MAG: carbon-nitrogen hydrolase family protein [Candidatus Pacearchaeota archaeon]|nr:carbon-nitrogen hydrolase family protein [Candidatus Pacearchaeota archaeon]
MKKRNKKIILTLVIIFLIIFSTYTLFTKPSIPELETISLQEWLRFPSPIDTNTMKHQMKIATTSLNITPNKNTNLNQITSLANKIIQKEPDTRLIVFPEASLGLYYKKNNSQEYQKEIAETIPGNATNQLGNLSKKLNIYLAIGLIEKSNNTLFNSLIVFDPNGTIIAKHRKQELHEYDVLNEIKQAENSADTFYIDNFKVGLSICADANKKWLINEYKKEQINLLIYSVASDLPWIIRKINYWPFATKYNSWIATSNRFGIEDDEKYSGYIFIADQNGAIHKKKEGSGYITTVIGKN